MGTQRPKYRCPICFKRHMPKQPCRKTTGKYPPKKTKGRK